MAFKIPKYLNIFLFIFVEQGVMNIILILICRMWALHVVFVFVHQMNYSLHSAILHHHRWPSRSRTHQSYTTTDVPAAALSPILHHHRCSSPSARGWLLWQSQNTKWTYLGLGKNTQKKSCIIVQVEVFVETYPIVKVLVQYLAVFLWSLEGEEEVERRLISATLGAQLYKVRSQLPWVYNRTR